MVDTAIDENDGDYTAGDLSLREAIGLANGSIGADTITFSSLFDSAQTINLTGQLPTIAGDLTITGPGQDLLTLDAGRGTDNLLGTGDGFRIFNLDDGDSGNNINVSLSGMALTGGDPNENDLSGRGGAIRSGENLTVTSSTISGNSTAGFIAHGGGIFSRDGNFTVSGSTISGNFTTGSNADGGGISSRNSDLMVSGSTISGNFTTGSNADGGGIPLSMAISRLAAARSAATSSRVLTPTAAGSTATPT